MTRSKPHNPTKVVTGGDSSRGFKASGLPDLDATHDGQGLIWNGITNQWDAEDLAGRVATWHNDVAYARHEVVFYRGELWRSIDASNSNLGRTPTEDSNHWVKVSTNIKRWKQFTDYKKGDVVIVPWSPFFLELGLNPSDIDHSNEVTLWLCIADQGGNLPVQGTDPASISAVPPGQYIKEHYGGSDPGHVVTNPAFGFWVPLTRPTVIFRDNKAHMEGQMEAVVPGSWAITLDTGRIYQYDGNPTGANGQYVGENGIAGWHYTGHDMGGGGGSGSIEEWTSLNKYNQGQLIIYKDRLFRSVRDIGEAGIVPESDPPQRTIAFRNRQGVLDQAGVEALPATQPSLTPGDYWEFMSPTPVTFTSGPLKDQTLTHGFIYWVGTDTHGTPFGFSGYTYIEGITHTEVTAVAYPLDPNYHNPWRKFDYVTPDDLSDYAKKKYVDDAVAPLVSGIEHGAAVDAIVDAPAVTTDGTLYIVSTAPTTGGAFENHANQLAFRTGGAWQFTTPSANEAHLNEADNTIYHWSGTKWNKIGSVAGPATTRRCTFYIPANAGYAEIDFGTDDWHQVTFDGKIELRAASERLTFALKKKDNNWSQNRDTVKKYDSTVISGRDVYSTSNLDDGHLGDWFNVCYNTDPSFNISAPYPHLKLQITKMYDNYIMVHSEISYRSTSSKFCVITSDWELDASEPNQNLRKFILNGHNSGMRIGIEGSLTVT